MSVPHFTYCCQSQVQVTCIVCVRCILGAVQLQSHMIINQKGMRKCNTECTRIQKVFSAFICRYFWKDLPPLIRTNIIALCLNHIYTTALTTFSKFHVPTVLRWALYNLQFHKACYLYDNQCIYINNTCPVEMFVNVSLNFCLMCVSFLFYLYLILHWIKCLCKLTQCNLDTAINFSLLSVFTFSLVYSNAHSCTKWQKSIFLFDLTCMLF